MASSEESYTVECPDLINQRTFVKILIRGSLYPSLIEDSCFMILDRRFSSKLRGSSWKSLKELRKSFGCSKY